MTVCSTNTSSFVSSLLMKPYLFLTLNQPFYYSQNLCCNDLLVPTGRRCCREAAGVPTLCGAGICFGSAEGRGSSRWLLCLSLTALGCGDGDGPVAALGLLRAL